MELLVALLVASVLLWMIGENAQRKAKTNIKSNTRKDSFEPLFKIWSSEPSDEQEVALQALGVDEMSGSEFEAFVGDLFEEVGFKVERTGGPGDLGADLVIRSDAFEATVQTKRYGEGRSVARRAVSDALAAKEHYSVKDALVVTNRDFSPSASRFAQGRCLLLGRSRLAILSTQYYRELNPFGEDLPFRGLSGTEFEAMLADIFEGRGWSVEQTKGSGDYGVDLILYGDEKVAVQAKRHTGSVSRRAVADAASGKDYYDCDSAWVVTSSEKYTSGAKTLAESTDVTLIGHKELVDLALDSDSGRLVKANDEAKASPDDLASTLREADRIRKLRLRLPWQFDFDGGYSVFSKTLTGSLRLKYKDAPDDDIWMVVGLPQRRGVSFSSRNSEAVSAGNTFAIPISGSGIIRFDITIDTVSKNKLVSIQQELIDERVQMGFRKKRPEVEELRDAV